LVVSGGNCATKFMWVSVASVVLSTGERERVVHRLDSF
jgi:hypothetical protein